MAQLCSSFGKMQSSHFISHGFCIITPAGLCYEDVKRAVKSASAILLENSQKLLPASDKKKEFGCVYMMSFFAG